MAASDLETTVTEKAVTSKKVKVKILVKKHLIGAHEFSEPVPTEKCMEKSASTNNQRTISAGNGKPNCSILGTKRRLEGALESQKEKRLKMNRSATLHCLFILEKLMKQRESFAFNEPVDPVKMGIPDYFDVIKHPMDLGTIKQKLNHNMYSGVEEFESAVRLTFSNAKLYNPPNNWVHQAAVKLMTMFDNLWKPVKIKINRQREDLSQQSPAKIVDQTTHNVSRNCVRNLPPHVDKLHRQTLLSSAKGSEDLKDALRGKVQRRNVKAVDDGKAIDDVKARSSEPARTCQFDPVCGGLSPRRCDENACSTSGRVQISHQKPARPILKVKRETAAKPVSKVPDKELKAVEVKNTSTLHLNRSDPNSDAGAVNCLGEHACTTGKTGSNDATTEGLESVLDIQLSPSKALRAAMLKSRFADTILKAQHKTLLQPGDRTDPVKLQQEKEKLERKQREEKAKIEAQIKAAESAARLKAESELQRQRKQQREAARIELEKMERSTDLDDNFHVLRELESLIGGSLFLVCQRRSLTTTLGQSLNKLESDKLKSPLERLGLFIKSEYKVGDDDDDEALFGDLEEGEVLY